MSRSLPVYGSLSLPVGEVDLGRRDWRRSHSDTGCGRCHTQTLGVASCTGHIGVHTCTV